MRIAVIGSGISGLSCAWILNQTHDVHLFEADSRLGGHAHTVSINDSSQTNKLSIDTGFLVYNVPTYPNLCAFFEALNVETAPSDMSLAVRLEDDDLEWAGQNMNQIFGQRRNLLRPRFYKMLFEILRFKKEAAENLEIAARERWSLRDLLTKKNYSAEFSRDYLIPMGAAIWSTPEARIFDFPAATFITFFVNHQLLQVNGRPVWRTVKNGSIEYVKRAASSLRNIHLATPVVKVERLADGGIALTSFDQNTGQTSTAEFDRVVLATHAPVTLKILANQSEIETKVLSAICTEANRAVLHRDASLMPKRQRCWSSWNVNSRSDYSQVPKVSLTYYINRLQPIATPIDYFLTLNPRETIREPIQEFLYHHPIFDHDALEAQTLLPKIQGTGGVYFAGAWSRYGFHEDGIRSGMTAARLIGVRAPWDQSK